MFLKRIPLTLSVIALAACGAPTKEKIELKGQYWQRISASESVYTQGPKAQQMLNRDIARCVVELRELERLGHIKNAIPTDYNGRVLDPDDKALKDWDAPERDQHLFAEHGDYHDFDSCMLAGGWERIKYVPYDVAEQAEENYYNSHINYRDRDRPRTSNDEGDYANLND